jgi:hypothetical protein
MREIRPYGSAGGGTELNQSSLPRSSGTLRVVRSGVALPRGGLSYLKTRMHADAGMGFHRSYVE